MRPLTGRACLELAGVVDRKWLATNRGVDRYIRVDGLPFKVSLHVHESVSEGERIVVTYGPGRPFLGVLMCEKPSTKGVVRLQRA
jgi:hypothetical protein